MSYRDDDQDLLNDPDKRVREAKGVLSVLWRQLLMVLNIDGWRWDKLMRKYLADPHNGIQNNSRDRSSARGNLNKELKRDDMTWRVFLKALKFLDPIRVVFTVKITFQDGRTYNVSAKLKDRGPLPPEGHDGDGSNTDPDEDPLDQVDELSTTEYRSRLSNLDEKRTSSGPNLINAMRSRDRS
jgi:hypothetical protein